ncbi:MAG: hypothetical protein MPK62_04665 [Alphaproteobacteria bacterium]|nr:hypothetical protein [Alphaproteobacteria bacterium]
MRANRGKGEDRARRRKVVYFRGVARGGDFGRRHPARRGGGEDFPR